MRDKVENNHFKWIKEMFCFMRPTKQIINSEQLKAATNCQYLERLLWWFFLIGGAFALIGGIFCIATFNTDKILSILLIVFGAIFCIGGVVFLLLYKNICARIKVFKEGNNQEE